MKNKKIFLWVSLLLIFIAYISLNPPETCYQPRINPQTNLTILGTGGCYPEYGMALFNLIIPLIIWLIIFIGLIIWDYRKKNKK